MTFHRVIPNGQYRALRLQSESGRWELGLSPYRHGMRLRMGMAGRPPQVMDFCLGMNNELFAKALLAVVRRLEGIPETSTSREIDAAFPWAGTRPDLALQFSALLECAVGH